MNNKPLSKLYDRLTPLERLPLLLTACRRGDGSEYVRLVNSAPRMLYKVPDYYWLAERHRFLCLLHLARALDLAALYWRASGLVEAIATTFGDNDGGRGERALSSLRLVAFRFCVEVDGWARFCTGLGLEAEGLLQDYPGWDTLRAVEQAARPLAFSRDEAGTFLRLGSRDDVRLSTPEELAEAWRRTLDQEASHST